VTWNKRQFDYDPNPTDIDMPDPEETESPDPEESEVPDPEEGDLPGFPVPTQPNSIGLGKPSATISWGKREDAADPPPTFWLGKPTATLIWPKPGKPTGHISWGKRQEDEVTVAPPSATITWGT
jgi:hypothetical protein